MTLARRLAVLENRVRLSPPALPAAEEELVLASFRRCAAGLPPTKRQERAFAAWHAGPWTWEQRDALLSRLSWDETRAIARGEPLRERATAVGAR